MGSVQCALPRGTANAVHYHEYGEGFSFFVSVCSFFTL